MSQVEFKIGGDKQLVGGCFGDLGAFEDLCDFEGDFCGDFDADFYLELDGNFKNIDDLDFKPSDELTNVQIDDFEQPPNHDFQNSNIHFHHGDHVIQIYPTKAKQQQQQQPLVQGAKVYAQNLYENADNVQNAGDANVDNAQHARDANANDAQYVHEQVNGYDANANNVHNALHARDLNANNVHNVLHACDSNTNNVHNVLHACESNANNVQYVHEQGSRTNVQHANNLSPGNNMYEQYNVCNANNVQNVTSNAQIMHEQYSACNANYVQNVNNVVYPHDQLHMTDSSLLYSFEHLNENAHDAYNVYHAHVDNAHNHMHAYQGCDNRMIPRYHMRPNLNPTPMKRRSRFRTFRTDFTQIYGNFFNDKRNHALKPSLFSNDQNQRKQNMNAAHVVHHPHVAHDAHDVHPHLMYDNEDVNMDPRYGQHFVHPAHLQHPENYNQFHGQKVPSDFSQNNARNNNGNFIELNEAEFEGILSRFEMADPRRAFLREMFQRKISGSSDSDLCSPMLTQEQQQLRIAQNINNNVNNVVNVCSNVGVVNKVCDQSSGQESSGKSEGESLFVSRLLNQIQEQAKDPKIIASVENKSVRRISSKKKRILNNTKKFRTQKI